MLGLREILFFWPGPVTPQSNWTYYSFELNYYKFSCSVVLLDQVKKRESLSGQAWAVHASLNSRLLKFNIAMQFLGSF